MAQILKVDHVTKKFGGLTAVNDVSFEMEEGMILGIIGPNGAGKTTLFNCICGLLDITEGKVYLDGEDITGLPPYKMAEKGIARAFQVVKPFGSMTALQNVMVGAFCRTNDFAEAEKIAMEALKKVFLDDRAYVKASYLNLGQRKRLEIAKSLATQPKLLLLDEVMAGLTPPEVKEMIEVVRGINKGGVTLMIIEHIMDVVMSLSDHIIVINFGSKIAEGTPEEVAHNQQVQEAYFGVEVEDEEEGGDGYA